MDSPGPVLYRHERIGGAVNHPHLEVPHDGAQRDELLGDYHRIPVCARNGKPTTVETDPRHPRRTLLRHTSVDELPQIINILKGEMSFVGPRPIVEDEVKFYQGGFEMYKQVRPGLSGLWQVSGRSDTSYAYRVSLDEYYIRHWTIWLDLYIMLKTAWVVIKSTGGY